MKKYEHAFGKNDIRGIYGEDITEELYFKTGRGRKNLTCGLQSLEMQDYIRLHWKKL